MGPGGRRTEAPPLRLLRGNGVRHPGARPPPGGRLRRHLAGRREARGGDGALHRLPEGLDPGDLRRARGGALLLRARGSRPPPEHPRLARVPLPAAVAGWRPRCSTTTGTRRARAPGGPWRTSSPASRSGRWPSRLDRRWWSRCEGGAVPLRRRASPSATVTSGSYPEQRPRPRDVGQRVPHVAGSRLPVHRPHRRRLRPEARHLRADPLEELEQASSGRPPPRCRPCPGPPGSSWSPRAGSPGRRCPRSRSRGSSPRRRSRRRASPSSRLWNQSGMTAAYGPFGSCRGPKTLK